MQKSHFRSTRVAQIVTLHTETCNFMCTDLLMQLTAHQSWVSLTYLTAENCPKTPKSGREYADLKPAEPHSLLLIGMLGIYPLLFVFLFLCFFVHRILVTDISGMGWCRVMKFCRVVDLGVHQVFSPLVNFGPGVSPLGQKVEKNFGNAYLVDRLRDRAEIL